jgi:hypothetical protein
MAHVSPANVKGGFLCKYSCDCDQSETNSYHLPSEGGFTCETDGINGKPSLAGGIRVGSNSWNQLGISALSLIMVDPLDSSVPSQEYVVQDEIVYCINDFASSGCMDSVSWDDPIMCADG